MPNRRAYTGIIVLTVAALAFGWVLAYRLTPAPSTSNRAAEPADPVVSGSMATAAFGSNIIFNAAAGNSIQVELQGDVESSSIANPENGQFLLLLLCQDEEGGRQMSWPPNVRLAGGAFALSEAPKQCDAITLVYDGAFWNETARAQHLASPHDSSQQPSEPGLNDPSRQSPPDSP